MDSLAQGLQNCDIADSGRSIIGIIGSDSCRGQDLFLVDRLDFAVDVDAVVHHLQWGVNRLEHGRWKLGLE